MVDSVGPRTKIDRENWLLRASAQTSSPFCPSNMPSLPEKPTIMKEIARILARTCDVCFPPGTHPDFLPCLVDHLQPSDSEQLAGCSEPTR
jgi:hypothetical protein